MTAVRFILKLSKYKMYNNDCAKTKDDTTRQSMHHFLSFVCCRYTEYRQTGNDSRLSNPIMPKADPANEPAIKLMEKNKKGKSVKSSHWVIWLFFDLITELQEVLELKLQILETSSLPFSFFSKSIKIPASNPINDRVLNRKL